MQQIKINGKDIEIKDEYYVIQMLDQLQLAPVRVAVEVNQRIVPKASWASHRLQQGDVVEVITLVGGG